MTVVSHDLISIMQIPIDQTVLDHFRHEFAPPDDPVFELVPHPFHEQAVEHYNRLERPVVTSESFWGVYLSILRAFKEHSIALMATPEMTQALSSLHEVHIGNSIELMGGYQEYRGAMTAGPAGGESTTNASIGVVHPEVTDSDDEGFCNDDSEMEIRRIEFSDSESESAEGDGVDSVEQ